MDTTGAYESRFINVLSELLLLELKLCEKSREFKICSLIEDRTFALLSRWGYSCILSYLLILANSEVSTSNRQKLTSSYLSAMSNSFSELQLYQYIGFYFR